MQPDQPNAPSQYDFLYQTPQQPKKSWLQKGNSNKNRLIIAAGGLVILGLLFFVLFSLIFGGRDQTKSVVSLAVTQTELIRVAEIGSTKASDLAARSLATTTQLSLTSAQNDTLDYLKKNGRKLDAKQLAQAKDSDTDKKLDQAALNNNFDATFVATLRDQLTTYQKAVKTAFESTNSTSQKKLLQALFDQTVTLLGQKPAS